MRRLIERLMFWRPRRDDLTWDEIVEFLSGGQRDENSHSEGGA